MQSRLIDKVDFIILGPNVYTILIVVIRSNRAQAILNNLTLGHMRNVKF